MLLGQNVAVIKRHSRQNIGLGGRTARVEMVCDRFVGGRSIRAPNLSR
jgi:hypothetical protein